MVWSISLPAQHYEKNEKGKAFLLAEGFIY